MSADEHLRGSEPQLHDILEDDSSCLAVTEMIKTRTYNAELNNVIGEQFSSYMNYPDASWNISKIFHISTTGIGKDKMSKDGNSVLLFDYPNRIITIYTLIDGTWVQKGSTFTDAEIGAINDDGSKVIISTLSSHLLTLYQWNGNAWDINENASISIPQINEIDMNSDGTIFIVGTRLYDTVDIANVGRARVFSYNNGEINQVGGDFLGVNYFDMAGRYVSINNSGTIIAVFLNRHLVRVFQRDETKLTENTDTSRPNFGPVGWTRMGNDFIPEYSYGSFANPRLSNDGYTIVIGDEYNDDAGPYAGHIRVFSWNGTQWVQKGNDIDGPGRDGYFGIQNAINGDGTVVVSTSEKEVSNGIGQARVFHWTGTDSSDGSWKQLGNILYSNLSSNVNYFGSSVSIDTSGSRLLTADSDQKYIFDLNLGSFQVPEPEPELEPELEPDTLWNISKIFNLSSEINQISKDGNTVLLGSTGTIIIGTLIDGVWVQKGSLFTDAKNGAINDDGSKVIIMTQSSNLLTLYQWNGNAWDINASISIPQVDEIDIDMNSDGTIFIVGNRRYNTVDILNVGRARVFSYNNGEINQVGGDFLGVNDYDMAGWYVSINNSGTIIAVFLNRYLVRVFQRDETKLTENTDTSSSNFGPIGWTRMGNDFIPEYSDGVLSSPRLSNDGYTIVIGDEYNDDAGVSAGHIRVHSWNGTQWVQKGNDIDGPGPDSGYGYRTGINGDGTVVVSASYIKELSTGNGQARVFHWTGTDSSDGSWEQLGNTLYSTTPSNSQITFGEDGISIDTSGSRLLISDNIQTYIFDLNLEPEPVLEQLVFSPYMDYLDVSWNISKIFDLSNSRINQMSKDGNSVLLFDYPNRIITIYTLRDGTWEQKGSTFTDAETGEEIGAEIGAINDDGSKVIIMTQSSNLTLYQWNGNAWDINASISENMIVYEIDMNSDGTIFIVGNSINIDGQLSQHRAQVFSYNDGTISQVGGDFLEGKYVSINNSGTIIAVFLNRYLVRVFQRDEFKLNENTDTGSSNFGPVGWTRMGNDFIPEYSDGYLSSPRLSNDGYTIVIGDANNDDAGVYAGHIRVHSWNGTQWVQKGNDIDGPGVDSSYGYRTGINGDGTVVVSASWEREQARIFHWTGTDSSDGSWKQFGNILYGTASSNSYFGETNISIDTSGSRLLISDNVQIYMFDLKFEPQYFNEVVFDTLTKIQEFGPDLSGNTIIFNASFCNSFLLDQNRPEGTSYFVQELLDKLNSEFVDISNYEIAFEKQVLPSLINDNELPAIISVPNIIAIEGNKTIDITFREDPVYIPLTYVGEKVTVNWIETEPKSLVLEKKDNHIYEVTKSNGDTITLDTDNYGQLFSDGGIRYLLGSLVVQITNPEKKGDMDNDNDIDLADVEILASYLAHIEPIRTNADTNPLFQIAGILDEQRDNITISDLTILISFLEGLVELSQ